jgi:hypothetical protein
MLPVFGFGSDGSILLVFKVNRASPMSEGVGVSSASSSLGVTGSGMETEDAVEGVSVAYSSAPYRDMFLAASEAAE